MSLLQNLPYNVYSGLLKRTDDWASKVAKAARLRNANRSITPKDVITTLDKEGCSVRQFYKLLKQCQITEEENDTRLKTKPIPASNVSLKVAILVANQNYRHWANLITPISDCRIMGDILKSMGFVVIIFEDLTSDQFKESINEICGLLPAQAYVLFYFAGHGFELCGTKYMLGVECPSENYRIDNGVSENFIMKCGFASNPDLFVLLLDMCRRPPDKVANPEIYSNIPSLEECKYNCNLIIGYATSPYMPALEKLFQECHSSSQSQHLSFADTNCTSKYIESRLTLYSEGIERTSSESERIGDEITHRLVEELPQKGISLYVNYLGRHLKKDENFIKILEMVHKDFAEDQCEQALLQKPQKLDNVAKTFYLTHKAKGDVVSENNIRTSIQKLQSQKVIVSIQ